MPALQKTNAMRILESLGISFDCATYDVDEDRLDAVTAASKLGLDPSCVFKTIVMRTDSNEIIVFCVPASVEVNLKKARQASGARDIGPVKPAELLALTSYVRGGCSPIGMRKQYRTFVDETVILHDTVSVSAGIRGQQLVLSPENLVRAASATICDLALEG